MWFGIGGSPTAVAMPACRTSWPEHRRNLQTAVNRWAKCEIEDGAGERSKWEFEPIGNAQAESGKQREFSG